MNDAKTDYTDIRQKLLNDTRLLSSMKEAYEKLSQGLNDRSGKANHIEFCVLWAIVGGALFAFIMMAGDRSVTLRIVLTVAMCSAFFFAYRNYKRHQATMVDYIFHAYLYKRILRDSVNSIYNDELSKEEDELRDQADLITEHFLESDGFDMAHDALRLARLARSYLRHSHDRDRMSTQACDDYTIYRSVQDII